MFSANWEAKKIEKGVKIERFWVNRKRFSHSNTPSRALLTSKSSLSPSFSVIKIPPLQTFIFFNLPLHKLLSSYLSIPLLYIASIIFYSFLSSLFPPLLFHPTKKPLHLTTKRLSLNMLFDGIILRQFRL